MSSPTSAPAGRRRYWVTVALFALANIAIWIVYDRAFRPRTDLLRVESFTPATGSTVGGRPTLTWRFNLDISHASNEPAPASITPQVNGKWKWADARTLVFTCDADLPKATRFNLALAIDKLRSEQGFHLAKPFISTIQTVPLTLVSASQIGFDGDDRAIVELHFNDNVLPVDVLKALAITGPDQKPLRCNLYGEASGDVVRIITDSIPAMHHVSADLALSLHLASGLAGTSGPLGLAGAIEQSVPISTALFATDLRAQPPTRGDASLSLAFNNDIDLEMLRPLISIEPKIPFQLESGYRDVRLVGKFQPATRYAVTIAKSPAGSDPAKYPRGDTLSVFIPDCSPSLWFEHDEGYLGSRGNRALLAHAVNVTDLRVSITRVYDNNLVAWRNANIKFGQTTESLAQDLGKPIASKKIHLAGKKNLTQDVTISLDDLLPADAGRDGAYRIDLAAEDAKQAASDQDDQIDDDERASNVASAMVTLSDLGICAKRTRDGISAWVVSLANAKPLTGVRIRAFSDKNQLLGVATTDENGLATIAGMNPAAGEDVEVLVADRTRDNHDVDQATGDLTWLDLRSSQLTFSDAETTGRAYLREGHEAFVYTERGVYRPGETVHLRAIVRGSDQSTPAPFPVRWQILRPDLRNWNSTVTKLDESGEALWDLQLPDDLTTGRWTARIGLPGDSNFFGSVTFQVEEFLPDRLKAKVTIGEAKEDDSIARIEIGNDPTPAHIQGDWLFGKPAAGLQAHVIARLDPVQFSPASFSGWVFGDSANTAAVLGDEQPLGRRDEVDVDPLDDTGAATAMLDLDAMLRTPPEEQAQGVKAISRKLRALAASKTLAPPTTQGSQRSYAGPWRLSVSASVLEPGGRAVTASRQADVDRVERYIALQPPTLPPRPGQTTLIPVAMVAPNGSLAAKSASLRVMLYRETWNNTLIFKDGHYRYDSSRKLDPVGGPMAATIVGGHGEISIAPPTSGEYVLRVCDGDQDAITSIGFVAAVGEWEDNISREDPEKLDLSIVPAPALDLNQLMHPATVASLPTLFDAPHEATTQPTAAKNGDSYPINSLAQVLVQSPFAGRLLLTVETDSVLSTQVIDMPTSHMLVPIAIPSLCRPNAYVSATVVRAIDPNATWRVHRAIGVAPIKIDNTDRRLKIAIDTPAEVRPTESLSVHVHVADSLGKPVGNASIDVAAVDEGICQLTNFATPDPFSFFYEPRALGVSSADLYSELMPEVARPDKTSAVGGDADAQDGRHHSPVSAKRVRPVALISNVIHTDENGDASVSFSLPQFVGQLRVMAIAHAQAQFGDSDSHTLVRSPLLVQSSWPRFIAPGDSFAVTITTFNNSPASGEVHVSTSVTDDHPKLRFVSSNQPRAELPPTILRAGGQSTQTLNAVADRSCGVAHVRLVATMGSEQFAEAVEIPIRPASPTITTGGYAIATPDAPASLVMPINLLSGTNSFEVRATPWPALQLPQGLEYLERYPYGCAEQTTSTLFPLVYLNDIGQQIAPGVFAKERVDEKIRVGIVRLLGMQTSDGGIAMWPGQRAPWPWVSVYAAHFLVEAQNAGHDVPDDLRAHLMAYVRGLLNHSSDEPDELETQAYACYVLALAGKPDRAAMDRIGELVGKPTTNCPQARFHLAAAWIASGRRDRAANLIPTILPTMRVSRQLAGNIGSAVRDRAILLSTLLMVDPDRADLPAIAQQLADAGTSGQWRSTQDVAFATMALGRYLRQCKPTANYAKIELLAGELRLASAGQGESLSWTAPTTQPSADSPQLRITGPAGAKVYLSWLSTGVPTTAPADADSGMTLRRRFLNEGGKPIDHNTVHSGDLVQVELTLSSDSALANVVIEDLLPAGLEIENPRLETSAKETTEAAKNDVPAFEVARVDMRDDRMVIVGDLSPGVGRYVYTCRAVTPGTFTLPPARAECMYDLGTSSIAGAGSFNVIGAHDSPIANTGHD